MNVHGALTRLALSSAVALALAAPAAAQEPTGLAIGDRAPAFQGTTDGGAVWKSSSVVGKELLVVYFYPAAMTAGCTKQACSFRDNRTRLKELGAEVVGVSGDRVENLEVFRKSNRLNFPLLSDANGSIARAFGVPVRDGGSIKRTVDGKEVTLTRDVTAARWTFIIGRDGRILFKETQVDPEGDSRAVIAAIERLGKN